MQGRFKREGSAAAEPELRGKSERGLGGKDAPAQSGDGDRAAAGAASAPKGARSEGSRLALRNWRISTRLVSLLALPVVAATSLGAIRISDSMDEMEQLDRMKLLTDMTKQATELAAALQEERDQSAGPLANGAKASDFAVKGPRTKTDRAKDAFVQGTADIDEARGDQAIESIRDNVVQISTQLLTIKDIRRDAYKKGTPTSQTVAAYNQLVDQLLSLSRDMALATSNPQMIQRTRTLSAFSAAKEYASIQRAVIAAALPPNKSEYGKLSDSDRLYALSAWRNEESHLSSFQRSYSTSGGNAAELIKPLDSNPVIKDADNYAERVLKNSNGMRSLERRSYPDWSDAAATKLKQMTLIEKTLLGDMEQQARELRDESQREAIINGALILLVLGVSLVGAFVVARSMISSLRRLQDTATKVAQDRLPELVKQLSETDPQDVDTSVESVGVHSRDEIGRVAAAFDDVHREAVRLAAEQALLRGNVNAMFTNLSRRSQGLIQRQLSLISELESREADPDQLSSLFKLDHLATRMRRNGENLLVLAGEEPGRRWTRPVPLVDVLRAAASEVEQYERIELAAVPTTEVAGRVVNDLVHLLAELLENATSFSSPQTKVKVTGHALPDGRVLIEIHDTGIGLSPEDLAAINERLASPPTVDVSVSRRMGLFVVGRLSQRHGIRIQLRPSDSGGTTALVMLPVEVAQGGKPVPGKPGAPAPSGGPAAAQAAAGVAAARRQATGGGGQGGPGAGSGGRLGAAPARGQVTGGPGPRAALPSRDAQGGGQGPRAGSPQGGPAPRGQQAPQDHGQASRPPQDRTPGVAGDPMSGGQRSDVFGGPQGHRAAAPGGPAGGTPVSPQQRTPQNAGDHDDRPQLSPRGGPRAELPGGNPQSRVPASGGESGGPQRPGPVDAPREHRDADITASTAFTASTDNTDTTAPLSRIDDGDQQGPGSTAQFARPDFNSPGPDAQRPAQHMSQQSHPGQAERPDELPPAGPGDGRTPLFDTLETTWFHGRQQGDGQQNGQAPEQPSGQAQDHGHPQQGGLPRRDGNGQSQGGRSAGGQAPSGPPRRTPQQPPMPPQAPPMPAGPPAPPGQVSWRNSPNDELGRQAERVRQPSAGGVTTSGLPRRVPRANLVAGTAEQQQQPQSGPQVSRSPDEVRGRLTNLRRGIQQGREAGSGQTGSFPRPSHQQER
ncbi:nitrate- and nitrite sensing domain-containing protein [Streptomyces sp. NPDC002851]